MTALFGRFWWIFDLTSHFRAQYAILLVLLAAGCLVVRKPEMGLVFILFATLNFVFVLPYCFSGQPARMQAKTTLRFVQMNVHTENRRYDLVKAFIRESNPDLIVLEEVNDSWMTGLDDLRTTYPHVCQQPRDDNFGIELFSKLPLDHAEIIYLGGSEVPSVTAEISVGNKVLKILGTHPLPPGSAKGTALRNQQLEAIPAALAGWRGGVILLGDLNTTPWSHTFRKLLRDTQLTDSGRGMGWQTTWPANLFPLRIAIDHCLVSPDLRALSRKVGPDVGSDHFPLVIDVAVE